MTSKGADRNKDEERRDQRNIPPNLHYTLEMAVVPEIEPEATAIPVLDDTVVPLQLTEEETTFLKTVITQDEEELKRRIYDVQKK